MNALPILNSQRKTIRVAYLGPEGTFTEQATKRYFEGPNLSFIDYPSIQEIFEAVEKRKVDYGVVPVENSIEGSVNVTLDLLYKTTLKIKGEITERIKHNLIVASGTRKKDVKAIISHPQAFAQLRNYLEKHFPKARLIEVSSTASAVKKLKTMKNAAAIGTRLAAELYRMKILKDDIGVGKNNYTRFLILGFDDAEPTGNDRTSVTFALKDAPGALYSILKPFAERNINLSKIESRPSKEKPWEYVFFMEFEGHRKDAICAKALDEAFKLCELMKILGSYPKETSNPRPHQKPNRTSYKLQ